MDTYWLTTYILQIVILIIGLLLAIFSRQGILIGYYAFFVLIGVSGTLLASKGINNMFLFHSETLFEFIILNLIFYKYFKSEYIKLAIIIADVLFIVIAVLTPIYWNPIETFNEIPRVISSLWFIGLSLFLLKSLMDYKQDLFSLPTFWYVSAIFFYFTINLMLFSSYNRIGGLDFGKYFDVWMINDLSMYVLHFMIIYGISRERVFISKTSAFLNKSFI
jgi:hypothetical protein